MRAGQTKNFALMAYLDDFQIVCTCQRDCWTLKISVLNGGKNLHLCTIPIIFILISSIKFIEGSSAMVLRACLKSFIMEFKQLFVNGFRTLFSYDSQIICMNLDVHDIREPIILRAMLINFTEEHLA